MKFFAISALLATTQAIATHRGDAYPAPILPNSEPLMPIPSAPIRFPWRSSRQKKRCLLQSLWRNVESIQAAVKKHPAPQLL